MVKLSNHTADEMEGRGTLFSYIEAALISPDPHRTACDRPCPEPPINTVIRSRTRRSAHHFARPPRHVDDRTVHNPVFAKAPYAPSRDFSNLDPRAALAYRFRRWPVAVSFLFRRRLHFGRSLAF